MALEELMEIEVPPRAQYLRVAMVEMNRILNHLMFFASFGAELGAITPTFYAFREREDIQYAHGDSDRRTDALRLLPPGRV